MSVVDTLRRHSLVDVIRVLVTVILGGIGGAAGFTHTHDWAVHHGQTGWLAWADAVVIEGIAIVAGFEVRRDHQQGKTTLLTFPMAVLVAGFGIQMTAQVALAEPTPGGWLLAAMPALGFLVVVKLLLRRAPAHPTTSPAPARATAAPMPAELSAPRTSGSTLAKLPASVRDAVTRSTEAAHAAGRPVTADDITAGVKLPDSMVTALVNELNATVNRHPVTT